MATNGAAKDFGRYLQSCRKARGISLGVVSHQTKITLENLRWIESERLDQLPSSVFVKGFIKTFAHVVEADPAEAILRFENRLNATACVTAVCEQKPAVSFAWKHLAVALVLFAGLIGATLYMAKWMMHKPSPAPVQAAAAPSATPETVLASEGRTDKQQTPMEKVQQTVSTPMAAGEELPPSGKKVEVEKPPLPVNQVGEVDKALFDSAQMAAPAVTPADTLELHIAAIETTWLKVVPDDKMPREFLLQTDQDVTLVADRIFNLTIGNAGGIRLMLNDQPVKVAGTTGQVVSLQLP